MGRERSRAGQHLYLCAAGLIMVALSACAPFQAILAEREGRSHLEQAELFTRQGNFEGALRENRQALALSPRNPPADAALFNMGLIFADHANPGRDYGTALGFFRQLVAEFPHSPFSDGGRVWIGVLENEIVGQEGRAQLLRVQPLVSQGDFEGALGEDRKVLARFPKNPPGDGALFSMGLIFADHANPGRDYGTALGFFRQLVKDFPHSPFRDESRVWIGVLENEVVGQEGRAQLLRVQPLVSQGDFEGALREDRKVLARFPKSPPGDGALFGMGLIFADHANPGRDCRKALGFFRQLVADFPHSPFSGEGRVWIGVLENEIEGQEERAQRQRMQLLIRKGDFEGALRENQKILAQFPKSPPGDAALFGMGLILADRDNPKMDYKKALSFFMRLKKEFPASPFVEEAKIWIGVLETMEKALQIDIKIDEKTKELRK
ncbi:MAG TPA: tetratricopeptide repeat protein [Desulfuromonadaceae bacterium]